VAWTAIDPTTGQELQRYDEHDDAEVERRVALAATAASTWRHTPLPERTALMLRVADLLSERVDRYAPLMTREMGKPIAQAEAEVRKCAWAFRHYAEHAGAMLAPESGATDARSSYVRPEPLGVVLAIMPWNFPFFQCLRFLAPTLALGNVGLLKHAPNVPGCALALEELLADAGAPEGLFQSLLIGTGATGALIADGRIAAVTLTGSDGAGRAVAAAAGAALKPCVLELGGSDPFVVLGDADLEAALDAAVAARVQNSGQSCIAAKRFVVVDDVHDAFVEGLVRRMGALVVGDPANRETDIGPLARADLRDALHRQVAGSVAAGASCALGGALPDGPGFFYPPTVLTGVTPDIPAGGEETFGPVAAVMRARDEEHAIELANATPFGLGASIWSTGRERAERLTARLNAGMVFVNEMVKSVPGLPFGGIKQSGFGRELGRPGLTAFANLKTVWVA
jgi:succinate-semialdehyde dehydrogenase/glutarate-semialdehyde dehydrogenase